MCRYSPSKGALFVMNLLNTSTLIDVHYNASAVSTLGELLTGARVTLPLRLVPLEPMVLVLSDPNEQMN